MMAKGKHFAPSGRYTTQQYSGSRLQDELQDDSRGRSEQSCMTLIIALILAASCTGTTWIVSKPFFATIDDARLQYVYAGYASGHPEGQYFFQNVAWSWLISTLYDSFPRINWYLCYHLIFIIIAIIVIDYSILTISRKCCFGNHIGVTACIIVWLLLFLNPTLMPHFEVTASLCGSSAILLIYISSDDVDYNPFSIPILLSVILMICCFFQEKNTFYSCSVFYILSWTIGTLKIMKENSWDQLAVILINRSAIPLIIPIVFTMMMLVGTLSRDGGWQRYLDYNSYRLSFTDYEHQGYDENQELYESLGWSREFYDLSQRMYYMDNRFSQKYLEQIVRPFNRVSSSTENLSLYKVVQPVYQLLKNEPTARFHVLLGGFVLIVFCTSRILCSEDWNVCLSFQGFLLCILFGLALILYLAWRGRLPLRAAEAVILPVVFLFMGLLREVLKPLHEQMPSFVASQSTSLRRLFGIIICLFMVTGIPFVGHQVHRYYTLTKAAITLRKSKTSEYRAIETYAMAHPDYLFVYGRHSQNYGTDALFEPGAAPTNLISWGTSYCGTPVWKDEIALFGLDELTSESFERKDVLFISNIVPGGADEAELLFRMLERDYGFSYYEVIDTVDSTHSVVRFVREGDAG